MLLTQLSAENAIVISAIIGVIGIVVGGVFGVMSYTKGWLPGEKNTTPTAVQLVQTQEHQAIMASVQSIAGTQREIAILLKSVAEVGKETLDFIAPRRPRVDDPAK